MNKFLAIVLLLGVSWTLEVQGEDLRRLLSDAGRKGKHPKGRNPRETCNSQPKDKCISLEAITDHPFCVTSKPCKFVPEYGEQASPFDEILGKEDDDSILHYLFKPKHKKTIYKIIDLGEDFAKSFTASTCEQPKKICDCKDTCDCDEEKHVKVCREQFRTEYGWYLVYNTKFCEPRSLLYYMLSGHGGGFGGGIGGGLNPYLLSMLKSGDGLGDMNPALLMSLFSQGGGPGAGMGAGPGGMDPYLMMMMSKGQGMGGLDMFRRHFVPSPSEPKPYPAPHKPAPYQGHNPAPYQGHNPGTYQGHNPGPYQGHNPAPYHPAPQTPYSPYGGPQSNIPFWLLLGGDHKYIPCEQLEPGYKPKHHAGFSPFGIDLFNFHSHSNAQVQFAFLKVKVPNGCECEK